MWKRIGLYAVSLTVFSTLCLAVLVTGCKKVAKSADKQTSPEEQRVKLTNPPGFGRSQDELHIAWAQLKENGKVVVVTDGKVDSTEYDAIGFILFSPDGKRVAFTAEVDSKWFMVVDGKAVLDFDDISLSCITFSPDNKHLAYVAIDNNNLKCFVLDGKEGTKYNGVNKPIFSKDSKHIAYSVMKGKKRLVSQCQAPSPIFQPIYLSMT